MLPTFFFLILFLSVASFLSLAPWWPTKRSDYSRLEQYMDLRPGDRLLDIGCGTASLDLYLAERHPGVEIVAIELSPIWYLIARIRVLFSTHSHLTIRFGNALHLDWSHFTHIYSFGLPRTVTDSVYPKFVRETTIRSRLISYAFAVDGQTPTARYQENPDIYPVYLYLHSHSS